MPSLEIFSFYVNVSVFCLFCYGLIIYIEINYGRLVTVEAPEKNAQRNYAFERKKKIFSKLEKKNLKPFIGLSEKCIM